MTDHIQIRRLQNALNRLRDNPDYSFDHPKIEVNGVYDDEMHRVLRLFLVSLCDQSPRECHYLPAFDEMGPLWARGAIQTRLPWGDGDAWVVLRQAYEEWLASVPPEPPEPPEPPPPPARPRTVSNNRALMSGGLLVATAIFGGIAASGSK